MSNEVLNVVLFPNEAVIFRPLRLSREPKMVPDSDRGLSIRGNLG